MKYIKTMSANDCGKTTSHQAGMCIPKDKALLEFLPKLDPGTKNPEAGFVCVDSLGEIWRFRYIYYNNKLHGEGTRNEYRITRMTKFIRKFEIQPGDELIISRQSEGLYSIEINHKGAAPNTGPVKLRGWRQIY